MKITLDDRAAADHLRRERERKANGEDHGSEEWVLGCSLISEVKIREVRWLWPNRIPLGKITLIAGHPGVGKSQVTCAIASAVSSGGSWPMREGLCEQGKVILLSAEDDPEDTVAPRMYAAGARCDQCLVVSSVMSKVPGTHGYKERLFSLSDDLVVLRRKALEMGNVRLIVIDPVSAYLGSLDAWRNTAVRSVLAPLSRLAAELECAVVIVTHLNKGGKGGADDAMARVMDSVAFTAAARSAYLCTRDEDSEGGLLRLFLPMKNNLAPVMGGLSYVMAPATLEQGFRTSRVEWGSDTVSTTADEAVAPQYAQSMTRDAENLLREALKDGPIYVDEVKKISRENGIGMDTMQRAGNRLGVVKRRGFGTKKYQWSIKVGNPQRPTSPISQSSQTSQTQKNLSNNNKVSINHTPCVREVSKVRNIGDGGADNDAHVSPPNDTRNLLPWAALADLPPDESGRAAVRVSILGRNALCINIVTRSSWTMGEWKEFAWKHFDMFTSVIGTPYVEGGDPQ